jgi:hypothetical protein
MTATTAATKTLRTATAPTTATFRPRTSLIHREIAPIQFSAAQGRNGAIPFGVVVHLNESKPLGLTRVPVGYDADPFHRAVRFK